MPDQDLAIADKFEALSVHREPAVVLEEAKKAAKALTSVIEAKKKKVVFNGETYLENEDWLTVARFYGVTARIRSTQYIEYGDVHGFEAVAEAFSVNSGEVVSTAESMCLNDEPNWSKKPLFQLRSMAQTRASSRVLRQVFGWVVVLAGYKPMPAEEMEAGEAQRQPGKRRSKETGDVRCADCGATNGHLPSCKYRQQSQQSQAPTEEKQTEKPKELKWLVSVEAVDERTSTQPDPKDPSKQIVKHYLMLTCINAANENITLYCWHTGETATRLKTIKPKTRCVFIVKPQISNAKTYYSIDSIVEITGEQRPQENMFPPEVNS